MSTCGSAAIPAVLPTYDNWTLDLQKELTPSMSLTVGYSGSKGTHLPSNLVRLNQIPMEYLAKYGRTLLNSSINSAAARAANIPIPYAGFGNLSAHTVQRALSPFPQYASVLTNGGQPASVGERAGNSTYHALVDEARPPFQQWSVAAHVVRALQAVLRFRIRGDRRQRPPRSIQQEPGKVACGLGPDARLAHRLLLQPAVRQRQAFSFNRPLNLLLGGWTVSSFLSYESGVPDTVASGASPIGTGSRVFITSYENWRAKPSGAEFDPNKDLWYDKSAFNQGITQATLDSQFGNATRNNPKLRTPWNLNENVSLGRTFRFSERFSFDLRGEVVQCLQPRPLGNANNGITSASFGRITTQGNTPRRMQIGMKLFF